MGGYLRTQEGRGSEVDSAPIKHKDRPHLQERRVPWRKTGADSQTDRPCFWAAEQIQPVLSCPVLSQMSGLWVVCPQAEVRSRLTLMALPPALVLLSSGSGVVFLGGRLPLFLNTHMSIPPSFPSIPYESTWALLWAVFVNISRAEQLGNNGQCGGFMVGEPSGARIPYDGLRGWKDENPAR